MIPILELAGVSVRFEGLTAADEVDIAVARGSMTALVGPNGAGKTTLFNVITGVQRPTSGRVLFAGSDITRLDTVRRARLGIARTFQNLLLVPSLSALENVTVGAGRFRRSGITRSMFALARREDRELRRLARSALEFVGIAHVADEPAGSLSYGDRRRLEVARALASAPELLLLDEPAAGMTAAEGSALAEVLLAARRELGVTIFLVEHDMAFVRHLAETTIVIDFGSVIASGPTDDVLRRPEVVAAYLGVGAR